MIATLLVRMTDYNGKVITLVREVSLANLPSPRDHIWWGSLKLKVAAVNHYAEFVHSDGKITPPDIIIDRRKDWPQEIKSFEDAGFHKL